MDQQHTLQANGTAQDDLGLGVEGFDGGAKYLLTHNPIHFLRKDFPVCGLAVVFKAAFGKTDLVHAWFSRWVDTMDDIVPKMAN